jgi:hypothetical protein
MKSSNAAKIIYFLLLAFIGYQFFELPYQIIGVDAGAILPTARDIVLHGQRPFVDIYTIYTPLSYYLYGVLYYIFNIPPMWSVILLNWIFIAISAFLIWKYTHSDYRLGLPLFFICICVPLTKDVKIECVAMPFLILTSLWIIKIFHTTDARLFYRRVCSIVGMSAVLFMFKQYYLILFAEFVLVLFFNARFQELGLIKKIATLVSSFIGFGVGILFIFLVTLKFNLRGLEWAVVLKQFSGKYIYEGCASFGQTQGIFKAFYAYLRYIILIIPVLLCIPVTIIFTKNRTYRVVLLVMFLLPAALFFFNINPHYLYIAFPFLGLFFFDVFVNRQDLFAMNSSRGFFLKGTFIALMSIFVLRNVIYTSVVHLNNLKKIKTDYEQCTKKEKDYIAKYGMNGSVYLGDGMNKLFVYRLNLKSINSPKIGYIFLYGDCLKNAFKCDAIEGSKLVIDTKFYE